MGQDFSHVITFPKGNYIWGNVSTFNLSGFTTWPQSKRGSQWSPQSSKLLKAFSIREIYTEICYTQAVIRATQTWDSGKKGLMFKGPTFQSCPIFPSLWKWPGYNPVHVPWWTDWSSGLWRTDISPGLFDPFAPLRRRHSLDPHDATARKNTEE